MGVKTISSRILRVRQIVEKLSGVTALENYRGDPFVVLISTILSQRTRDENTVKASDRLFSTFKTPREIADAPEERLMDLIRASGFYRTKAKRIKEVSRIIVEEYSGRVPEDMKELLKLPGVGRKTANCVLVFGYGKPAIPVDTHVHRISNRLGLVSTRTPRQTEERLTEVVPREFWLEINQLFVRFGQELCRPVSPKCDECPINGECMFKGQRILPSRTS